MADHGSQKREQMIKEIRPSEFNMNTKKFHQNLSKLMKSEKEKVEVVIVLLSGSFNPVHSGHVDVLELSKKFLEEKHKKQVVCGYLAPSSDSYVKGKLKEFAMPLTHRNQMCREASKHSDWIDVCEFGMASASKTLEIVKTILQNEVPPNVKIIGCELFGADHAAKYALWRRVGEQICVCTPREPHTQQVRENLKSMKDQNANSRVLLLEPPDNYQLKSVSSTAIRDAMMKSKGLKEFVGIGHMDADVVSYIEKMGQKLFFETKKKQKD